MMSMRGKNNRKSERGILSKKISRRRALSTAAKVGIAAGVGVVVGVAGGFLAGSSMVPATTITSTVEKTVTSKIKETVTATKTTTVTTAVTATPTTTVAAIPDYLDAKIDWRQFEGETLDILNSTSPMHEWVQQYASKFEELTGIKINWDRYSEREYADKVVVAAQSKTGVYDVLPILPAYNLTFAMQGWDEELEPYLQNPSLCDADWYNIKDFFEAALGYGKFDPTTNAWTVGKQYALPFPGAAEVLPIMFYRKDVLNELGLSVPKTFDELEKACKTIQEKRPDITPFVTRGCRMAGTWNIPLSMIYSYGGNFFDEEWYPILNRPEAIEAVKMYVHLLKDYGPPGASTFDFLKALDYFASGNAVFYLDSNLFYGTLTDPEKTSIAEHVGFAPMPAGPAGSKASVLTWTYTIDPHSDKKEIAWLYVMWATSAMTHYAITAGGGGVSCRRSALASKGAVDRYGSEFIEACKAGFTGGVLLPLSLIAGKTQDIFSTQTSLAVAGEISAEEACLTANEQIYEAMKEAGYYEKPPKYGKFGNNGPVIPHSPDWKPR